jgi:hypothetical protein
LPAIRSASCSGVNVASPSIGLAVLPLNGTTTPAFWPAIAGPWKWPADTGPLRPE